MPFDSEAERESGELGFERDAGLADLGAERRSEQEQSGLGEFSNNPYSDAALLKRQRDASSLGQLQTVGNQLYAGSTINAQAQVASQYDQGLKGIESADAEGAASYERGVNSANRGYQLGLGKIKEGAINRALESEPAPLATGRGRGRAIKRAPTRPPRGGGGLGGIRLLGAARRRGR